MTVHRTIKLDDATDAQLRALAQERSASPEEVLSTMISKHLSYEEWFSAEVRQGVEELDSGRFVSDDEVWEEAAKRRAELLARDAK